MTVFESFKAIPGFPDYMVGSHGKIYNHKRSTWPLYTPTQNGDLTVGLTYDGVQYRRSVKVLVAEAHVPGKSVEFDTPILLDGDKGNLRADNIEWRPRWFAWRYSQQFDNPPQWAYSGPVYEIHTGQMFESVIEAAIATGSLMSDIRHSFLHKKPVFPHNALFAFRR